MAADDLARRLVESPHWRWLPGMLTVDPGNGGVQRLVAHDDTYWHAHSESTAWLRYRHDIMGRLVPALSHDDPATEGCLLWLARELYPEGVRIWTGTCPFVVVWDSRGERWRRFPGPPGLALVHAIHAAGVGR